MLSLLSNAASQLNNSRSQNIIAERKCGFCRCVGHTIKQCSHPTINSLDEKILNVVAITNIFPFLKELCIRKELELLTVNELKVLSYKFEGSDSNKKYLKHKAGLIKLLSCYYYEISKRANTQNLMILQPVITKIYMEFQFDIRTPNRVPDSSALRRCADIAYENLPEQRLEYFKMTTWISQQIENHYRDYTEFLKSQEFTPHRFEILTLIQEQQNEDYTNFECPICQEDIESKNKCVELGCKHKYCTSCIGMQLKTASEVKTLSHPNCAMCRAPITDLYFNDYFEGEAIHNKYTKKDRSLLILIDL